ncbi:MAG: hydantoinase/oxoprolinase family protein [Candidatus Nitrosocosmicus sp.]|jgi:N-methylhydantoinase A/oxoprolinase/acetone carboxylase beta subunit|uniref:hydantoinase/oxoprolinase family protein n=1 Tax=Candidatus Nitrosocosmicus agrestis TaxID=2563600 RepID=UPI00122E6924|nr:hydantoinase/oxoprolinase family protein [Candidatus Nitrosocosmicus sp. SS]KAA2283782.1 methylhydantoinase [Candidatus Nitrosocosmicus sp. SS]KAF0870158.1 methylhydantoinase [Candidatus Nitrosocosmicus sp. SS]MDR4489327.1 methylhydantoinase [Candidatus Nitrosocosmicus sp.]HET6591199.1 hydantoinase/oxoprolinase family protein [Candidatus Nitrosocosmicus sp.]
MKRIRIGIDVGGTFTKAVAIDVIDKKILGKKSVPTTHATEGGVSVGIITALSSLIEICNINHDEIELISHSTTQAVNAFLEGDVSKVGIIGMGVGMEKTNVVKRTHIKDISLNSNKYLRTCYTFLDTSKYLEEPGIVRSIENLVSEGAQSIVVSEAFGVDDPSNELFVMKHSKLPCTAGHELTGIYGLEIRTLTATINASILPKATSTATFVKSAVSKLGINVPVMIMKGDGGVTTLDSFLHKPIITVLSGPAASVVGALLFLQVLEGIFIEVGGTSTNISIIKDGKPEMRYVNIMEHPTCIRSLDARICGVAGGSLIRLSGKRKIIDVGPRSSHIAGLEYSCFGSPEELKKGEIVTISPLNNDPDDYICIKVPSGKKYGITNTCAANALNLVPTNDNAYGNGDSARIVFSKLATFVGATPEQVARQVLEISVSKISEYIVPMIKEYKLSKNRIVVIGGGGGASVLVPLVAKRLNFDYKKADYADVISSIGVATGMIYEEKERTIHNPTPEDVNQLITEVKDEAIRKNASPDSLSVQSEYISDRSLLRVTAMGNVTLDLNSNGSKELRDDELFMIAKDLFQTTGNISLDFRLGNYCIYTNSYKQKKLFFNTNKQSILVLDKFGRVRLSLDNGKIINGLASRLRDDLPSIIAKFSNSDLSPNIRLLDGFQLLDFSSLNANEQVIQAIREQLDKINSEVLLIIKQ